MMSKKYGLSDEEKKRKEEFEKKEYENLPWDVPIQHWSNYELSILQKHKTKKGISKI